MCLRQFIYVFRLLFIYGRAMNLLIHIFAAPRQSSFAIYDFLTRVS